MRNSLEIMRQEEQDSTRVRRPYTSVYKDYAALAPHIEGNDTYIADKRYADIFQKAKYLSKERKIEVANKILDIEITSQAEAEAAYRAAVSVRNQRKNYTKGSRLHHEFYRLHNCLEDKIASFYEGASYGARIDDAFAGLAANIDKNFDDFKGNYACSISEKVSDVSTERKSSLENAIITPSSASSGLRLAYEGMHKNPLVGILARQQVVEESATNQKPTLKKAYTRIQRERFFDYYMKTAACLTLVAGGLLATIAHTGPSSQPSRETHYAHAVPQEEKKEKKTFSFSPSAQIKQIDENVALINKKLDVVLPRATRKIRPLVAASPQPVLAENITTDPQRAYLASLFNQSTVSGQAPLSQEPRLSEKVRNAFSQPSVDGFTLLTPPADDDSLQIVHNSSMGLLGEIAIEATALPFPSGKKYALWAADALGAQMREASLGYTRQTREDVVVPAPKSNYYTRLSIDSSRVPGEKIPAFISTGDVNLTQKLAASDSSDESVKDFETWLLQVTRR